MTTPWSDITPHAWPPAQEFCEGYKQFLDRAKTEREAAAYSEELLTAAGYQPVCARHGAQARRQGLPASTASKCVLAATIGTKSRWPQGFHLGIAHIDAPRLDLRPVPLYEDKGLGYFRTHYYGGVRKYQWAAIPLALHGTVCHARTAPPSVDIDIGEKPGDPVFCITDLLPHLAAKQNEKKLPEGITGENLNVLIASTPIEDKDGRRPRQAQRPRHPQRGVRHHRARLHPRARSRSCPPSRARDVGLDRAMIGAYGHDDRVDAPTPR